MSHRQYGRSGGPDLRVSWLDHAVDAAERVEHHWNTEGPGHVDARRPMEWQRASYMACAAAVIACADRTQVEMTALGLADRSGVSRERARLILRTLEACDLLVPLGTASHNRTVYAFGFGLAFAFGEELAR